MGYAHCERKRLLCLWANGLATKRHQHCGSSGMVGKRGKERKAVPLLHNTISPPRVFQRWRNSHSDLHGLRCGLDRRDSTTT